VPALRSYWREPSDEIEPGDLFASVPLLTLNINDQAIAHEDQIFLPTRVAPFALLLKIVHTSWWFVPVLTQDVFEDGLFNDILEQCNWGQRSGWFALPPLDGYPPLNGISIVLTLQPTLHRADAFEDAEGWRVASLTPGAYDQVCKAFHEGFSAT
jgi:hypothetical protein